MENLTRRSLLVGLSTAVIASQLEPFASAATSSSLVFIGGYTEKPSTSLGIYSYGWDAGSGELTALGLAAATDNPSFLAISKDKSTLYAANEVGNYQGKDDGSISSFSVDASTGRLTVRNVVSSGGDGPAHIRLSPDGETFFSANYGGGSVASFKVLAGGGLSSPVADISFPGHGPNLARQEKSHAHTVTVSPDGRYLLVNDLGLDKIHIFHLNAATAQLAPNTPPAYQAIPASGPRSFAFHPNGRFAYSTNELSNTVDALHWNAANGTLTRVQNITTLPEGFKGSNTAASVVVSADGRFVYVSNRGDDNSLTAFAVDFPTGKLSFVQRIASGGKIPRHFAIDPSGKWVVVAHQGSNTLVVFARDITTGKLTETGRSYPTDQPTCVLFA